MPAATTRLFYESCNLPHILADNSQSAVELISAEETVCVPSREVAVEVLIEFGLSPAEAEAQVNRMSFSL
jgi:hypothetical protein